MQFGGTDGRNITLQGVYKSTVVCPDCDYSSVTFENEVSGNTGPLFSCAAGR